MGKKCIVPLCATNLGFKRAQNELRSLFKPPKDEIRLAAWEENIPKLDNRPNLDHNKHFVCDLHFYADDIIWPSCEQSTYELQLSGGCKKPTGRPRLQPDAVPFVFPSINYLFLVPLLYKI